MKPYIIAIVVVLLLAAGGLVAVNRQLFFRSERITTTETSGASSYAGKKIFWVNSYHTGMPWPDGIGRGIDSVLNKTGVELKTFQLDTKNHPENAERKALEAKKLIDEFKPDVIIASDDNAQKYLVVPYLKDSGIPVVFVAVNWEAGMYGYPNATTTGMVEVDLVPSLLSVLKEYAKGDVSGHIGLSTETFLKNSDIYNKKFFGGKMKIYPVKTFEEFQTVFAKAQNEVHMLFVANFDGMPGWNPEAGKKFMLENTRIPTGYFDGYLTPYVLVTVGKIPEEQGEYAAQTALKIFDGAKISGMQIVTNEKGDLGLNLQIAEKLGIVFQPSELKTAKSIITKDGETKQLTP